MNYPRNIFSRLEGTWRGECLTWFESGKPGDESIVDGTFRCIHGGILRHEYVSEAANEKRTGDETIMFNALRQRFEVSWIDSFHMSSAIMFSVGEADEEGFTVTGSYDVGPDHPRWGWKTCYRILEDQVVITAFNVTPHGDESKAVETTYLRAGRAL